jgi:hypothetical protein
MEGKTLLNATGVAGPHVVNAIVTLVTVNVTYRSAVE